MSPDANLLGLILRGVAEGDASQGWQKATGFSRIGGLFTAMFFCGGALGSALAAASLVAGGWQLTTAIGMGFAAIALMLYGSEFVRRT